MLNKRLAQGIVIVAALFFVHLALSQEHRPEGHGLASDSQSQAKNQTKDSAQVKAIAQQEAVNQTETKPQAAAQEAPKFIGEFFGNPVPIENYYFIKGVTSVFGIRGASPKTQQEEEDYIWDQLLLSFESFRRNIQVPQEELDNEITQALQEQKVDFDWKKDLDAYRKWANDLVGEQPELFENQIRHLLQIDKLNKQILDSFTPLVKEEEAAEQYLNEYNSLDLELAQFADLAQADAFYQKAKESKNFWEDQKKKNPKDFKRIGFVTLAFLMDLWQIPKDALYKMIEMKKEDIYQPEPIYKGYAVFKIWEMRKANMEDFAKLETKAKDGYFAKMRNKKKHQEYADWFKKFKQEANIKIYPQEIVNAAEAAAGTNTTEQKAIGTTTVTQAAP